MSDARRRPRPLVAGNWKMNGLQAGLSEAKTIVSSCNDGLRCDIMLCPPTTLMAAMAALASGSSLRIGGQDCHVKASGAHTGDISAEMLKDAGAAAVIVGHSERRADHAERDADVQAKALAAHRAGLTAIVCVGETAGERQSDLTLTVVGRQLERSLPDAITGDNTVVAYEPVWAIGTGLTPTAADVAAVHADIRARLVARYGETGRSVRILYGGSVKPSNARELMAIADVDGALVGGASLTAKDFMGIVAAYQS